MLPALATRTSTILAQDELYMGSVNRIWIRLAVHVWPLTFPIRQLYNSRFGIRLAEKIVYKQKVIIKKINKTFL